MWRNYAEGTISLCSICQDTDEGLHLPGKRGAFFYFPQRHYLANHSPEAGIMGFKFSSLDVVWKMGFPKEKWYQICFSVISANVRFPDLSSP